VSSYTVAQKRQIGPMAWVLAGHHAGERLALPIIDEDRQPRLALGATSVLRVRWSEAVVDMPDLERSVGQNDLLIDVTVGLYCVGQAAPTARHCILRAVVALFPKPAEG